VLTAGTFYQDGKRVFWDVHNLDILLCGQGKAIAGDSADYRNQPASPSHTVYLRDTIQPMSPPTMTPSVNVAAIVSTG